MYQYNTTVVRWIDGDTVELAIDLGFKLALSQVVRLYGINCPEVSTEEGLKSKLYVETNWPPGTRLLATTVKPKDKYGRWLALLIRDGDEKTIQIHMIEKGYALIAKYEMDKHP